MEQQQLMQPALVPVPESLFLLVCGAQMKEGQWLLNMVLNTMTLSWVTQQGSCAGYFNSWLGIYPLQLAFTATCVRPAQTLRHHNPGVFCA